MIRNSGNPNAKILVIDDSPDSRDEAKGEAFSNAYIFRGILQEIGITSQDCLFTTLCQHRPLGGNLEDWYKKRKTRPDPTWAWVEGYWLHPRISEGLTQLKELLVTLKPQIVIILGNLGLWAFTGEQGLKAWRGSILKSSLAPGAIIIPTYPQWQILRDYALRPIVKRDLQRVGDALREGNPKEPAWDFTLSPTKEQALDFLAKQLALAQKGSLWLGCDLETRAGHIACLGIATSATKAICLPFMKSGGSYFEETTEHLIVGKLKELLTHSNCKAIFQNGSYDLQYFQRWWGFVPNLALDTMVVHHSTFSGMPKNLGFLASLYCSYYVYWKESGKTWAFNQDEEQLWRYCCFDCVHMVEVALGALKTCKSLGLLPVAQKQHDALWPNLWAMNRGLAMNVNLRSLLSMELKAAIVKRQGWINEAVDGELNVRSPKQMAQFFYTDMRVKPVISRKTHTVTTNDEALKAIGNKEAILRPVCEVIAEIRSLGTLRSTFVEAQADIDGRMRSSFNLCGTETYRLSSGTNAFWTGMNLQNVSKGNETSRTGYPFPNLRKMFIPDKGMEFFDMDLDRADLQVVVWEAEDEGLKKLLRLGVDLHIVNGLELFGKHLPPLDELVEGHPNYSEHKARAKGERQFAKSFIHGTNYGGGPRTMAITAGITTAEAEKYQSRWFSMHPGIRKWQTHTEQQLARHHFVENKFGYRRYYFERIEGLLPEALAWVPQSTVGILINRIWEKVWISDPEVEVLLQVHDSLGGQFPIATREKHISTLRTTNVVVPYNDPLVIPTGLSLSTKSWGHC